MAEVVREESGEGRPDVAPDPDRHVYVCDRCGDVMEEIHCKIMCPTCGYFRDCSDP